MIFAPSQWATSVLLVGWLAMHLGAGAETFSTRPDGPDAERLGMKQGYPVCAQPLTRPECRVGAWSANETIGAS
jgi:hypothetical protein